MEFNAVIQKALQVREKYAQLEKQTYGKEWTKEQIAQGFVGDVGDLLKIIMAKEGIRNIENPNEKLSHELSDCLWAIIVLADKYGVDLEKSFTDTMEELDKSITKKLEP